MESAEENQKYRLCSTIPNLIVVCQIFSSPLTGPGTVLGKLFKRVINCLYSPLKLLQNREQRRCYQKGEVLLVTERYKGFNCQLDGSLSIHP